MFRIAGSFAGEVEAGKNYDLDCNKDKSNIQVVFTILVSFWSKEPDVNGLIHYDVEDGKRYNSSFDHATSMKLCIVDEA